MKRKNQSQLEIEIRRRVEAKYDERNALLIHLVSYAGVNVLVWVIWLSASGGFPWPLFVTFFWGIGMAGHLLDYYHKHGGGAQKREERIQEEVLRQLQMIEEREERLRSDEADGADVYELDDFEGRGLRLSDDGELIELGFDDEEQLREQRR
ncbi:MAG: 2TM domain-containing protein [Chloroflexi bacterium]|nr:2TM domain-containing protein [Chloroflexota bacterium]